MTKSPWRTTWLHFGLLVLALAGAWLSFERPFAHDADGVSAGAAVVVQAAEGEVERVVYERGEQTLEIEAREDDLGRWFAGREGKDTVFVGGRQVATLWRGLEPLRAVRVLEGVDGTKLEELGLAGGESAPERLGLTVRGREVRYRLGGRPFGGADRYARREFGPDGESDAGGTVLVLPSEVASSLGGGAELLMERRLLTSSRPDVKAMSLRRPGSNASEPLRILQRVGANPADTYWTVSGSDEADADIGTWADKFFRLSVVAYRSGEHGADWRPEAVITVESREHGASTLEIWSVPAGEARVWLARSPFTRFVVELSASLAEEVCADLDGLL
ncbi:MAG: hypothetical protein F4230_13735 [Holophagales bacterium]|nr:hypothetical protein [Holophagales bacterium]MYF05962.1 hypothetical protein [Holophagales bacterium]MYJ25279.1 hypothetical protein [Holophagales bacterium]